MDTDKIISTSTNTSICTSIRIITNTSTSIWLASSFETLLAQLACTILHPNISFATS